MKAKLMTPAGAFLFLSIAAFAYFLLTILRSIQGDTTVVREFTDGIGVELIGALLTSLGIIGLEQLYSPPDAEVAMLRQQLEQQSTKLTEIQAELRTALARFQIPENDDSDASQE